MKLTRLITAFTLICTIFGSTFGALAQNTTTNTRAGAYGLTAWAINNQRTASQYNYDVDSEISQGAALSLYTFPISVCQTALSFGGNRNVNPFSTNATVKVLDIVSANTETVALNSITFAGALCTLSLATSNTHTNGSFHLRSGTCGLAEALNDLNSLGGEVIIDQKFYDDGCTQSTITGSTVAGIAQANQFVHDISNSQDTWYALKPTTLSLISSAGAAPTVTITAGASTFYLNYEYIDAVGGIGLPNTETAQQTSAALPITEAISATAPSGAVGWIPMITAAGGSSGAETEVPVTSTICTLAVKSVVKPACAIGATATISTAPGSTAKEVVESAGHTTFAYQPIAGPPSFSQAGLGMPQTSYGPFAAVSTISSGSNSDVAQWYLPAGALNYLGKSVDICFKINYSVTSTGVPTLTLKAANQYAQSPVTLATFLFPTQAAAVTTNGCVNLNVAATGSSGNFWVNGNANQMLNSSQVGAVVGDVTTAVSSNLDLTKGLYFTLNMAAATASVTSLTVNSLTIRTVPGT